MAVKHICSKLLLHSSKWNIAFSAESLAQGARQSSSVALERKHMTKIQLALILCNFLLALI